MNVIIYVVIMLMVIASLTYAKLESTRSFVGMRKAYHLYMKSAEIGNSKIASEMWYKRITVKSQESGEKTRAEGLSRLSLYALVNKDSEKNLDTYRLQKELLKLLLHHLYHGQPFFKEISAANPHFLDELVLQIEQKSADSASKIDRCEKLTNLEITPENLKHVLVLIINGMPNKTPNEQIVQNPKKEKKRKKGKKDTDDEAISKLESDESRSPPGYISMVDCVSMQNSSKIRVFLASRALLTAIYEDTRVVDSILQRRKELYRQLRNKKIDKDAATKLFTQEFSHLGKAEYFAPILNFAVTAKDPAKYEK